MPYTPKTAPDAVKDLPSHAQDIWISAYNNAYKQYNGDEGKSNATAWAAVKKQYEKNDDGEWVKLQHEHGPHECVCPSCGETMTLEASEQCNQQMCPECGSRMRAKETGEKRDMAKELQTVDLEGIEILATGTWRGSKTVTLKREDLEEIAEAFNDLQGDSNLNYDVPIKLGHDEEQKLLQKDGYPSGGWVSDLKVVGDKLVADITGVPAKLGQLIKAGAYKKVSAELMSNFKAANEKTYGKVLTAVSLLGGDIPAVKTIKDIVATYSDEDDVEVILYEEQSIESILSELDDIGNRLETHIKGQKGSPAIRQFMREAKSKLRTLAKANMAESDHTLEGDGDAEESKGRKNEEELNHMDEKEIRELLGLSEDADVKEALTNLKQKAESKDGPSDNTQLTELSGQVATLKQQLAEEKRDKSVAEAMRQGKIMPAQKEWADTYALSDPNGFAAFVEQAPKVVEFGARGSGEDGPNEGEIELTDKEVQVANKMGLDLEEVKKSKKEGVTSGAFSGQSN